MTTRSVAAVAGATLALALVPAAAPAHPGHHHPGMPGARALVSIPFPLAGPSAGGYSSPNVEFVKNFPQHTDSAGARKVGDHFYITTERDLTIYDVSEPLDPVQVGHLVLPELGEPVFTEEDPDTNGEILLIGNNDVLMVIDVRDKSNPAVLSTLDDADDHTITCVLDCSWAYGSEGTIVDLRDPENPVLSASNWQTEDIESEHDVTEVSPGIVLTSTQPLKLLDAREDPEHPEVLASTPKEEGRFTHANLWPRGGQDDYLLVGGEAVGPGCSASISASFSTWDARSWRSTGVVKQVDEFRLGPGTPAEGRAPDSSFCVHWFDEHPYYANGGLVAIGWYEHGTHFLRIGRDGQIDEVGWFLGGGGQASAAYWIDERTVYVADYLRGLDVLRFTGDIGSPPKAETASADTEPPPAPPVEPEPPVEPPAPDVAPAGPACVAPPAAGVRRMGGRRLGFTAPASAAVDVFRLSRGRRVTGEHLVARFPAGTGAFTWNGRANRPGRRVTDGFYVVRYRTSDATRRVALRRVRGRWLVRPPYQRGASCDLLAAFGLSRPVFGGRTRRGLRISYRVQRDARVTVSVLRGRRVVRRFRAFDAAAGRTYRLRLGAGGLRRGRHRVRIVAARPGERVVASAISHRL